jgi:hypothetical protein
MRHFISKELGALNAMTIPVDASIVAEFSHPANLPGKISTISPGWDSDISWISAADEEAFAIFQSAFDRLGVAGRTAEYLDLDREVRLYAGFLIMRSCCNAPYFHVDWQQTNNEAFTFITPVTPNASDWGLLYHRVRGDTGEYRYKTGEGIVFGDKFVHSTKPGQSDEPVILLCFEFGTDKMVHWPKIYPTVGYQVSHIRQPDGQFVPASGL